MANRVFGVLGWLGTALVFGAVAIRFALSSGFLQQGPDAEWNRYAGYAAWAGLACVLIYMAGQWRDLVSFYGKRQARYGTLSIVSIVVALAIVVAVNYLAVRQSKRWDFTENQVYSLSEQSIKVLQGLDAPVKFTVYDQATGFDRFRGRLEEYAYHSSRVSTEYVDVDRAPSRAKAAGVQAYGTIVVEYKDKVERLSNTEEGDITNALIKVTTGQQKKVYFTQGHGEKDTASSDRAGYAGIVTALSRDNYGVERLALAQAREVPADATVVVVAGLQTDFLSPEIDALKAYVARGGKVLFLLDPPTADDPPMANVTAFLKEWGIDVGNDVVLDASGIGRLIGTNESVPVAVKYSPHPITERFEVMTAYPLARSVRPVEGGSGGHNAQTLVETSPQSWAETDLKGIAAGKPVGFDAAQGDKQGPVPLGAAVSAPATSAPAPPASNSSGSAPAEPPKPESRIVAIGDSDFAANFGLGIQGNRDFFLNSVNWLAQQENLIAIRPREPQDRRITLTADQQDRIWYLTIFIIPGLVFATGVYTWWRRR